jgi:glycosyltransferase involved in cell wall biosynthesis
MSNNQCISDDHKVTDSGPLVSVIIPTFGRPQFLADAIGSVLGQTCKSLEVIVVDDASLPPVHVPVDSRIRLVRHERNMGPGASRNTGFAHAVGRFVVFLDDDDLLLPHRLEQALQEIGEKRAHASAVELLMSDGQRRRVDSRFRGDCRQTFHIPNHPAMGQVVHRREDVLQFDPALRISEDKEWWIRMADRGVYSWSDEVGLLVRRHQGRRDGVDHATRYRTRRQILQRHQGSVDRRARAELMSFVAAAALTEGLRFRGFGWALLSVGTRPTVLAVKRLLRAFRLLVGRPS